MRQAERDINDTSSPSGHRLGYRILAADATRLAGNFSNPKASSILFCGGYRSSFIDGQKADFLYKQAQSCGLGLTLFDYSGHGVSDGVFEELGVVDWFKDTRHVLESVLGTPQLVIGSSMGGWLAMLLARDCPALVQGLILLAPACDFPQQLWTHLTQKERQRLTCEKILTRTEADGDEQTYSQALFRQARFVSIFDYPPIAWRGKLRILHGTEDVIVPLGWGRRCLEFLDSPDKKMTELDGEDHRLSSPRALACLWDTVREALVA